MATYFAEQVTNEANGLAPSMDIGNVERRWFNIVVPTGGYTAGSILVLAKIHAGKRITGGQWTNTAGGAAATGKIQNYKVDASTLITDSKYGTLTDMTGATLQTFANTNAKGQGYISTDDEFLAVLTAAQTIQAGAILAGYVDIQ